MSVPRCPPHLVHPEAPHRCLRCGAEKHHPSMLAPEVPEPLPGACVAHLDPKREAEIKAELNEALVELGRSARTLFDWEAGRRPSAGLAIGDDRQVAQNFMMLRQWESTAELLRLEARHRERRVKFLMRALEWAGGKTPP